MLAGVSLCALFAAAPAVAQQSANERVYRQEALAHARAVTTAWRRLESYILEGSAGTPDPDGASVSGWSGRGSAGRQRLACRLDACVACGRVIAKTRCWSISRPSASRASAAITARSRQRPMRTPAAERWPGAGAALAGSRPGHGCRGPPFGDTPRLPVRYRFRRAAALGSRRARRNGARSLRPHERTREPRTAGSRTVPPVSTARAAQERAR